MTDRLKIFRMLLPAEFVLFDHNPKTMTVQRRSAGGGRALPTGGVAGTLGALFHGTDPMTLGINEAHLVGPEAKPMCDTILGWLSPASGIGGAIAGGIASALGLDAASPPTLVVQWGPPAAGFTVQATLQSATITYLRIDPSGVPLHAKVNLTLQEQPSILSMTNPTSGGRPGRRRHVVTGDETLASIATEAFGVPGAWRAIAEVNGIDDPSSVRPGDVVYLPARDELRELAAGARP